MTALPEPGPARDRLVAEVVGWIEVHDGLGGMLWLDRDKKPTGYYTANAGSGRDNPFRPSWVSADALAALEAWVAVDLDHRWYRIERDRLGFTAVVVDVTRGKHGAHDTTLPSAATAALLQTKEEA